MEKNPMRSFFAVLTVCMVLGFSAWATEPVCDSKCQAYKHAHSGGPVHANCKPLPVYFKQARVGSIVIRFYDAAGKELDKGNKLHSIKNAGMEGHISPCEHWFRKAAYAELCNSFEGRVLTREHLETILQFGRTPPEKFVHLDKPRTQARAPRS